MRVGFSDASSSVYARRMGENICTIASSAGKEVVAEPVSLVSLLVFDCIFSQESPLLEDNSCCIWQTLHIYL